MTFKRIDGPGGPFAGLIEDNDGTPRYLVPPIVFDLAGNLIQGQEILEAVVRTGVAVQVPQIHNATVGDLAAIDQQMQNLSTQLGVPIGPPA